MESSIKLQRPSEKLGSTVVINGKTRGSHCWKHEINDDVTTLYIDVELHIFGVNITPQLQLHCVM